MTKQMYLTTSWDDGSIYDLKLAEVLAKYGVKGTFYVTSGYLNNNKQSLSPAQIKELAKNHEIGSHTHSHIVLTEVDDKIVEDEIKRSKETLENIIGQEIRAFCPAKGKYNNKHLYIIRKLGFLFIRTTGYLRTRNILDRKKRLMHTTLQFYPYRGVPIYLLSALKRKDLEGLGIIIKNLRIANDWEKFSRSILETVKKSGGVFHLWGHSWEIERYNLWNHLELFLKYISETDGFIFCTNSELWEQYERI